MADTSHGTGGLTFDKRKRALPGELNIFFALIIIILSFRCFITILIIITSSSTCTVNIIIIGVAFIIVVVGQQRSTHPGAVSIVGIGLGWVGFCPVRFRRGQVSVGLVLR